jgi:hypothetical protein
MSIPIFSTTIFFAPEGHPPVKYRNVNNIENLAKYCAKFGEVYYINCYDQKTKKFIKRVWIKQF